MYSSARMKISLLSLLVGFLILVSCKDQPKTQAKEYHYFDLKTYITDDLFARCEDSLKKSVAIDEVVSDTTITTQSAREELEFMGNYSIDNPNYYGKYKVDSLQQNDSLSIHYMANSKRLKVKEVNVTYYADTIRKIELRYESDNFITKEVDLLTIQDCSFYLVQRNQPRFGQEEKIEILYRGHF